MSQEIKNLGIDIGGHTLTIAEVVDPQKPKILNKKTIVTPSPRNPETLTKALATLVAEYVEQGQTCNVGLAIPGALDKAKEFCYLTNFGNTWCNLPKLLKEELRRQNIIATVKAENDANAVALGEKFAGQAKDMEDFVCVTLGTGIGGGVFVNNRLLTGSHGLAGELGHMFLEDKNRTCPCGGKGHLEAFVGAYVVESEAKNKGLPDNFKELWQMRQTSQEAGKIVSTFLDRIAFAFCTFITILDPQAIFLYGGVSKSQGIIEEIKSRLLPILPTNEKDFVDIRLSDLGEDAAIFGVALGL